MSIYCFSRIIYHLDELEHLLLFFFFIYLFIFSLSTWSQLLFWVISNTSAGDPIGFELEGEGELGAEGGKMTEEENAL